MRPRVLFMTCVLLGAANVPARGASPSADAEVFAGAGLDTNPFLQVAATPQSPLYRNASNVLFARLMPALRGRLAGPRFRLELRYDGDFRALQASGHVLHHQGSLGLTLPEVGRFTLGATVIASRYDDAWESTAAVRFVSLAGRIHASTTLSPELKLQVSYRYDRRFFEDVVLVEGDVAHVPEVRLAWRPTPALETGVFVDGMVLGSMGDSPQTPAVKVVELGKVERLHAGVDAWHELGPHLTASGALWIGRQWSRDDTVAPAVEDQSLQFGGALSLQYVLTEWLDATFRFTTFVNRAQDPALNWSRHMVALGVVAHARAPSSIRSAPAEQPALAPEVTPGGVTFRVRSAAATDVQVIGSWNDWRTSAPRQWLRRAGDDGMWQITVPIGPGEHRYRFLVDGKSVRPPDAPQYASDEFGGEDGVVEVP